MTMSLEETELKIGGASFKGVYLAIVLSLATSLGGGVWTASSLYSRLQGVESQVIPDVTPISEEIGLIKQQLADNDVSQLKAKLAELGANLTTIMEQQQKLLTIQAQVTDLEKDIEAMRGTVTEAKLLADGVKDIKKSVKVTQTEIEDLWKGLDYLSNPLN